MWVLPSKMWLQVGARTRGLRPLAPFSLDEEAELYEPAHGYLWTWFLQRHEILLCYRQTVTLGAAAGRKMKPSWNCMGEGVPRTLLGIKMGRL